MNSPCLLPPFRSEAFAEDLDPPAPLRAPARRMRAGWLLALVPLVLILGSGVATVMVRWA
jgi:hypothetical protein